MAIYLEIPKLQPKYPFRILINEGDILTTPHWHKEIEIILIKSGTVNLGINNQPIQAVAGDVMVVGGGEIHYVLASLESERIVFQFDLNFFQELTYLKDTSQSLFEMFASIQNNSQLWKASAHHKVVKLLEHIYTEYKEEKNGYRYAIKGYMCTLIMVMYRELANTRQQESIGMEMNSNKTLEKLDSIFRYVELHYANTLMLDEVADYIGFSTYYFAKFFKKTTGKTFITFLNEYRVEKAKWLILNEDVPIFELIERTGFGSTKTFYRIFKQITGCSPSSFKKEYLLKAHQ